MRTESSDASDTFCARVAEVIHAPANTVTRIRVSKSSRICRSVFDNFITRHNLSGAAQGCGDAAILLIREFDRSGHRLFGNAASGDDVFNVKLYEGPRKLFASIAIYFDAIVSYMLPLLFENVDHVHPGASAERHQQELHRRSGAVSMRVSLHRLRVAGGCDAH